jgi:thiol-disulfide isomerase/thioredoxin
LVGSGSATFNVEDTTKMTDFYDGIVRGKVLLIQFTGVGCGPCHQSVPFLKELVEEYKTSDFEFLSIETWSNNMEGLKRYQQINEFNFKFLKSTDEVTKSYGVTSVPVFFVIDENRIIREVIKGYSVENTDKKIKESINKYL